MPRGSRLAKLLPFAALTAVALLAPTGTLHTLLYSALLLTFGRTLLPNRTPLVTVIARQLRGGILPAELSRYTRHVTWAWTLFCGAQLATSALLHQFATHQTWWIFVNLLNLPLLALMATTEYIYRRLHYRHHTHTSAAAMLAVMRRPLMWAWVSKQGGGSAPRPR